jgi:hypothetical protein
MNTKEMEGAGQGKAKINIKLVGEVGGTGTVTLSRGEWEGVQQVLQEKQADENARYRDCGERLTPLFLEKFVTKRTQLPREPTISGVHSSSQALLVYVNSPTPGDAVILINDKDISAQLKSEDTPRGMKIYTFEYPPEQLNLSAGKNEVIAKYPDAILPAFDFKSIEMQKQEAQKYFDLLQQIEALRKQDRR